MFRCILSDVVVVHSVNISKPFSSLNGKFSNKRLHRLE